MLVLQIVPKNDEAYVKLAQCLIDKKFRYYIDYDKKQIINFESNRDTSFLQTVCNFCEIRAIMKDDFTNTPFVSDRNNDMFTYLIRTLQEIEADDTSEAISIMEQLLNFLRTAHPKTCKPVETANIVPSENIVNATAETATIVSNESTSNIQPVAEHCNNTQKDHSSDNLEEPTLDEIIKKKIAENPDITLNECALFPSVYLGIESANKANTTDNLAKIKTFLDTIGFPTDEYIITMFLALDEISAITYGNIDLAETFSKSGFKLDFELRTKIRDEFKAWAKKHCPSVLNNRRKLSLTDIMKLYKRFVK